MSWWIPVLLGAWHGVNPAMGWLFAVALGLQEQRAAAMLRALPPIALGHAASVAAVMGVALAAGRFLPPATLRIAGGAVLLGYATYLMVRRAHPRRVGMRLSARGLFAWSFVMASAHGAGLMLLPVVLGPAGMTGHHMHHNMTAAGDASVLAVHSAAMLTAMATIAVVAYRAAGVGLLRRAWIDTDILWSGALAVAGVAVLLA